MATLVIPKNYEDATVMFESDLDDFRDSVQTFINVTKLNDDNLQNAGITGSTKLIDGTVTGTKLNANVVDDSTLELASNVLQVKDLGITGAKLNANTVDNSTIELLASALQVKDGGITNAKVGTNIDGGKLLAGSIDTTRYGNLSVTNAKIGDVDFIKVNTYGAKDLAAGSATGGTPNVLASASVVYGATGRGAMISIIPAGGDVGYIMRNIANTSTIEIKRDAVVLMTLNFSSNTIADTDPIFIWDNTASTSTTIVYTAVLTAVAGTFEFDFAFVVQPYTIA